MSRAGDCYDNALAESFFGTLKAELVRGQRWPSRRAARLDVFEWIEVFYNRQRRHSALAYWSPVGFEASRTASLVALWCRVYETGAASVSGYHSVVHSSPNISGTKMHEW